MKEEKKRCSVHWQDDSQNGENEYCEKPAVIQFKDKAYCKEHAVEKEDELTAELNEAKANLKAWQKAKVKYNWFA